MLAEVEHVKGCVGTVAPFPPEKVFYFVDPPPKFSAFLQITRPYMYVLVHISMRYRGCMYNTLLHT